MNNFNLYDKIEAYLRGDMNPEDKKAFETEIANNPELSEQVDMHRFEWDGMEVLIENDLRDKMATWQAEENQLIATPLLLEEKKSTLSVKKGGAIGRRLYYSLAMAASFALLIGALFWVYMKPKSDKEISKNNTNPPPIDSVVNQQPQPIPDIKPDIRNAPIVETPKKTNNLQTPTPKKIPISPNNPPDATDDAQYVALAENAYKEEIPDYETISTTRTATNNKGGLLDEAAKAYQSKDFAKVVSLLKNTTVSEENFTALELLAHAHFQLKQYKQALPIFENILKLSGRKSLQKSEWYLLVCYAATYKTHTADFKNLSQKILADSEHDFYKKTIDLVNQITKK